LVFVLLAAVIPSASHAQQPPAASTVAIGPGDIGGVVTNSPRAAPIDHQKRHANIWSISPDVYLAPITGSNSTCRRAAPSQNAPRRIFVIARNRGLDRGDEAISMA